MLEGLTVRRARLYKHEKAVKGPAVNEYMDEGEFKFRQALVFRSSEGVLLI